MKIHTKDSLKGKVGYFVNKPTTYIPCKFCAQSTELRLRKGCKDYLGCTSCVGLPNVYGVKKEPVDCIEKFTKAYVVLTCGECTAAEKSSCSKVFKGCLVVKGSSYGIPELEGLSSVRY